MCVHTRKYVKIQRTIQSKLSKMKCGMMDTVHTYTILVMKRRLRHKLSKSVAGDNSDPATCFCIKHHNV